MKVDALYWKDQTPSITGTKKMKLSYTNILQKEKGGSCGLLANRSSVLVFISIWKKARWIPRLLLSKDNNILPQGLTPPIVLGPQFFSLSKNTKQNKKQLGKGLRERSLKLVRGACQVSFWKKRWIIQVGSFYWSALALQWFILLIEGKRLIELWDWKLNRQHLNDDEIIAHH